MDRLNRVRGMFAGHFISDTLGSILEFRCNIGVPYTGVVQHRAFYTSRFQGRRELAVGQVTDDSELTITLLRSIIKHRGYHRETVIQEYIDWANSGLWMLGKNTRALLKGIKTIGGYRTRIQKVLDLPEAERSQSNGALMRASPLALVDDSNVELDTGITNPNTVCIDTTKLYVRCLKLALSGMSGPGIFATVVSEKDKYCIEVQVVIQQVINREARDIAHQKGWCLHALWCTLMVITSFTDYEAAMRWVITSQPGSDTDTNAAISGALLGAILGFEELMSHPVTAYNFQMVVNCDTTDSSAPRQPQYTPRDFMEFTAAAAAL